MNEMLPNQPMTEVIKQLKASSLSGLRGVTSGDVLDVPDSQESKKKPDLSN
jgi:hypothetical protein